MGRLYTTDDIVTLLKMLDARFVRMEHQQHRVMRAMHLMEDDLMALKTTDQALIAEVHRNTDVSASVKAALTAMQATEADLTAKLAEAIANSDASDDADVLAVVAELKANNDALLAAIPALSTAIPNTDPNAPIPTVPNPSP